MFPLCYSCPKQCRLAAVLVVVGVAGPAILKTLLYCLPPQNAHYSILACVNTLQLLVVCAFLFVYMIQLENMKCKHMKRHYQNERTLRLFLTIFLHFFCHKQINVHSVHVWQNHRAFSLTLAAHFITLATCE